jgi:transmembrane sensor
VENTYNHIDDLIGKYLAGEASRDEVVFVESWIKESEANRIYFNQIKTIFTRAASITAWQEFNTDDAWNKVKSQLLQKREAKTVSLPRHNHGIKLLWKIAASIIIVLGIGFYTYRSFGPADTTPIEVVAEKKSEADTLPDGSGVFLNKETKLAYTYNRKKKAHVVKLKGEAYFNINHKDDKTFIVDVDGVFIKDIGTSFNVKAYPESNTIEVVVEEGEVIFYTDSDSGVYLYANGKGVYNKATKKFTVEQPEANVTAYKTRFFIFSDTDLSTVVQTLNDVYDKKITLSKNLSNCRLTVTFNNETIDEIVTIIAETLALKVVKSDSGILLEGDRCDQ